MYFLNHGFHRCSYFASAETWKWQEMDSGLAEGPNYSMLILVHAAFKFMMLNIINSLN